MKNIDINILKLAQGAVQKKLSDEIKKGKITILA